MSLRGISMSVLAFLFTASVSTALIVMGPGEFANRTLLTVLLIPFIWGLAMFYCYWDNLSWRPALMLSVATLCAATLIAVNDVQL